MLDVRRISKGNKVMSDKRAFEAAKLAAELGLRIDAIDGYLLAGLTPHEIRACAGINATNSYIDAFGLVISAKRRVELNGGKFVGVRDVGNAIMIDVDNPGGPTQCSTIALSPRTVRRSKRYAAMGTFG
jgi:hypothetical protein